MNKHLPKIIMDERERGEMRTQIITLPCDLQIKTIDVGDFVLSKEIGIERKRGDDFTASLMDNRLFMQALRMKQVFLHPMIIIENLSKAFKRDGMAPQSIYGAMTYLNVKFGISLLLSENSEQTALMIWSLANQLHCQGIYPPDDLAFLQIKTDQITRFDQKYFLQGLLDVGDKRSDQLLDMFGSPGKVLEAIMQTEITYNKAGKPKGLNGPLAQCEGIGPKFLQNNAWLFQSLPVEVQRKYGDLTVLLKKKKVHSSFNDLEEYA
jgi:Fanconi anemia group M protein